MAPETKLVSVNDFPLSVLETLRQHLRNHGIVESDAAAVRFAAIERANQIALKAAVETAAAEPDVDRHALLRSLAQVAGGPDPGPCSKNNDSDDGAPPATEGGES